MARPDFAVSSSTVMSICGSKRLLVLTSGKPYSAHVVPGRNRTRKHVLVIFTYGDFNVFGDRLIVSIDMISKYVGNSNLLVTELH